MRDFYDIAVISEQVAYDMDNLKMAWGRTSQNRGTSALAASYDEILQDIHASDVMRKQWENYTRQTYFVDLSWDDVCMKVEKFADVLFAR